MTSAIFLSEILRYFVGFLLLAAVFGKLRSFAQFRSNLHTSFGVRPGLDAVLAPVLIAAELGVAVLVLTLFSRVGMAAALLMFLAFTALLSYKFFTQSVVKCACFGGKERPVSGYDLLRNLLVCAAIAVYLNLTASAGLALEPAILAIALASLLCTIAIEFHLIVYLLVEN